MKLFHRGQVDHIDVATDQSLHLSKYGKFGTRQGKVTNIGTNYPKALLLSNMTDFTCCFPPMKASSKSSLFLDSNLHQPFLEWAKAHNEVPIRFTRLVKGRKLSLCLSSRQCPPPSNQIHKTSPSFIEPLPLLFRCINGGCVV